MSEAVLITGGARGIGAAITRHLVEAGYEVVFTYNRSAELAQQQCDQLLIDFPGAHVSTIRCDLGDTSDISRLCAVLEKRDRPIYGFIHNAGISYDSLAAVGEIGSAQMAMQVNYWSFVQLYKTIIRPMMSLRKGRMIVIGSVAAEYGNKGNSFYASTKAALAGFARSVLAEVAGRNITINCIAPGFIETALLAKHEPVRDAITKSIPANRYGRPEEVAALAGFLLSDNAEYINGQTITIDGGLSKCAMR